MIRRKRVLAAKIESTPYTAEAGLSAADAAFNVYDAKIEPAVEMNTRPRQGGFGDLEDIAGKRMGTCTFSIDFSGNGSGTTPAWFSTFMPACGWSNDGSDTHTAKTQAPEDPSATVKTLTIATYEDGLLKMIKGAMGSWKLPINAGSAMRMEFTFVGALVNTSAASILAPTYPTILPWRPSADGTGFTYDGTAWCFESMTIDSGNDVQLRPCQDETSGYKGALVANRVPTITFNPEAGSVLNHTKKFTDWLASNSQTFAAQVINVSEDIVDITSAATQITNLQEGERAGLVTDEITLKCLGVNPLQFAFSAV